MSSERDITKKSRRESGGSFSKPQPDEQLEPQTDHAPASDEGPDKQQGRKKKEPAQLTTYDPAEEILFSNWDGEEGPQGSSESAASAGNDTVQYCA